MTELTKKKCVPCEGGVPSLKGEEVKRLLSQIETGWKSINDHHLEKEYKFPNFAKALEFVNKVGAIAEQEGHHPNIDFTWGKAKITLYTHEVDGLSENDFILAAKIDQIV